MLPRAAAWVIPGSPHYSFINMAKQKTLLAKQVEDEINKVRAPQVGEADQSPWDVVVVVPGFEKTISVIEDPGDGQPIVATKHRKRTTSISLTMYDEIYRGQAKIRQPYVYSLDLPFRTDNCAASRRFKSKEIIRELMNYEGYLNGDFQFVPVEPEQLEMEKRARQNAATTAKLKEIELEARSNTRISEHVPSIPSFSEVEA